MRVIDENDKCNICGRDIMKSKIWYRDTDIKDDVKNIICNKCEKKLKKLESEK